MPEGSAVLSAIARRRLQEDEDTPLTKRPLSSDREEVKIPKRPRDSSFDNRSPKLKKNLKRRPQPISGFTSSGSSEHGETGLANQFSSLAAYAQPAGENGKIEELARGRLRATVAQGKKLFVSGSYRVWIKSGTVSIYGAILPASEATYRVYAPSSHSVPVVEVLSGSAEVELSSLDEGLQGLAKLSRRHLWDAPDGAEGASGTFFVLGHHFLMQPDLVAQRELDISPWYPILNQVCESTGTIVPSQTGRILVTGKRSTGTSTFVRCLINRLLTARLGEGASAEPEVLLVDLDPEAPETTPPGLVAIARIKEPLLGPAFTHPSTASEVVKIQFLGNRGVGLRNGHLAEAACDLLRDSVDDIQRVPVVIRMPAWIANIGNGAFDRIWNALKITQVVQVEGSTGSTIEALANDENIPLRTLTPIAFESRTSAFDDRDLRLRSYFRSSRPGIEPSPWHDVPLTANQSARYTLSFTQPASTIGAVLLLDPTIDPEDTFDAMLGSICAIMALSTDFFEQNLRAQIWTAENGLPRLMTSTMDSIPATVSTCLGLAYLAEMQTEPLELVIYTPVSSAHLQKVNDRTLLLVNAGRRQNGYWGSDWIADELEKSQG